MTILKFGRGWTWKVEVLMYAIQDQGRSIRADSDCPERSDASANNCPPTVCPADAEVDIEVLKSVPKAFCIEDERTANWLVRKIIAAREYAERVKLWSEQECRRAQREEMTLFFLFGRQAEAWAKGEIEKQKGKRKSIPLPAGVIGFRTVNACLQVDDEQAVLRWASEHCPSAVVVVKKLSRTELKGHFEKTGEVPPEGAHVEPRKETFFIR